MHRAARLVALDETGTREHVQVFHHRGKRDRERCSDLGYGEARLTGQSLDDGATRRVRQSRECEVEAGV
jgi:hypothetical protein